MFQQGLAISCLGFLSYGFTGPAFPCLHTYTHYIILAQQHNQMNFTVHYLSSSTPSPWCVPHDLSLNRGVTFLTHLRGPAKPSLVDNTHHEHLPLMSRVLSNLYLVKTGLFCTKYTILDVS